MKGELNTVNTTSFRKNNKISYISSLYFPFHAPINIFQYKSTEVHSLPKPKSVKRKFRYKALPFKSQTLYLSLCIKVVSVLAFAVTVDYWLKGKAI